MLASWINEKGIEAINAGSVRCFAQALFRGFMDLK